MIRVNDVIYPEVEDFETIINQLCEGQEEYSLDLPPFYTRYPDKLETIIDQIQSSYFGFELYQSLEEKAARLFYFLNKDHAFINGNKRVSVMAFLVFLAANKEELYFDQETIDHELYEIATITAASLPEEMDEVIDMLVSKTKQYIYFK